MNIKNVAAVGFDEGKRKQTHVAGKTDKVYFGFFERGNYLTIMLLAKAATTFDHQRLQAALCGECEPGGIWLITDYSRNLCIGNAAFTNGLVERKHV